MIYVTVGEPTAIVVTCVFKYKFALGDTKDVTGKIRVVSRVNRVTSPSPVAALA